MGGLAEWWLALNVLQGGPFGLTVLLIAVPMAAAVMLPGYVVVEEQERLW